MQFESLFLEKNAQLKFALLRLLNSNVTGAMTIADLSASMALSYQQTYNLFQEILGDCESLTNLSPAVLRKAMINGQSPVGLDNYRLYLLRDAIAFEFFDYVIQGHHPNIDCFCAEHFVSRSTLTRKTVTLRRFLATYGLKLTTTSTNFIGGEAQIRLCLHAFYWQATHGAVWPFTAISQADIHQQAAQLPTHYGPLINQQLMYLLAISRLRIAQDHQLTGAKPDGLRATPYFTTAAFPQMTSEQIRSENQFLAWYQLGLFHFDAKASFTDNLPPLTEVDQITAQLLNDLASSNHPDLAALAKEAAFCHYLHQATTCFYLLQSNYVKLSDFFAHHYTVGWIQDFNQRFTDFITALPRTGHAAVFHKEASAYCKLVSFLAAPFLQNSILSRKVNVAVELGHDDILHRQLLHFLQNQSFVSLSPVSANTYDLLITEADSLLSPQTAEFACVHPDATLLWGLDVTETDFRHLYHQLWQRYYRKMAAV